MAEQDRFDERTEPATPRRREEARERGHVARSQDLSSAVILLAAVVGLFLFGETFVGGLADGTRGVLGNLAGVDGARDNLLLHYGATLGAAARGTLPLLVLVVAAALAVNLVQVGFLFNAEGLAPKLGNLDPVQGFRKIFSLRSLVRLAAGLLKIAAVGAVVFASIWIERARLLGLSDRSFDEVARVLADLSLVVAFRAVLVLLVLAVVEYGYQRWQYERDLRMSRQEVREELRRYEGDPRIRERRRAIQRQLALQRMMQEVPKATVVITNPTHVAVALEYRPKEMPAPRVVAKGAELLAQRIREAAMEHGVPLVERPELARALYRTAEVGQQVPVELYQAVAEVMAYVFRLRGLGAVA